MNILNIVSNPGPGMGYWVSISIIASLVLILFLKGKLKTELTEIEELENEVEIPHKEGNEDFILITNPETFAITPICLTGYYADVKFKIGGICKTLYNVHSFTKFYVGRKLEITYFTFFKLKISFGEHLLT